MGDDKQKAGDIARNIWLAGVGAYGRAVQEAQGRLEKAMEPPKLFRDLVKAGAALEEEARETTEAARHSVEERINRVRENFHNQRPARIEDLEKLNRKVDQLTRKVNKLIEALAEPDMEDRRGSGAAAKSGRAGAAPAIGRKGGGKKAAPGKSAGKQTAARKKASRTGAAASKRSR